MAHFRGEVQGRRTAASRLGHKTTGLRTEAQSWEGKVVTYLTYDAEGLIGRGLYIGIRPLA